MIISERKKILLVPDYFAPYDNPAFLELRRNLRRLGYHVTIFCPSETFEKSRKGLERGCERGGYDLIVTLETGCLLAAGIAGSHRIYVNPDWTAWSMSERFNIVRGAKLSAGWFTPDELDSHLADEHQKHFGSVAYPPAIGLDTGAGIRALSKEIDKIMKSYE